MAPAWMADVMYAEKFGCHPHEVEQVVSLRWWERWQWYEKASAARAAVAHGKRAKDWTNELSASERELILWANADERALNEESNGGET